MRFGDSGSGARFFYCAKASKRDRDEGCEGFEAKARPTMGSGIVGQPDQQKANNRNNHPTVKPTALMRYLCRLVTPPNGTVLDPFMGSGSTGKAAMLEGFNFIGIEREAEYIEIAKARINWTLLC
jgi:site-specific DNA-methyltransferase (adenine-specific)